MVSLEKVASHPKVKEFIYFIACFLVLFFFFMIVCPLRVS